MTDTRRIRGGVTRACGVAVLAASLSFALAPGAQAGKKGADRPMAGACETSVTLVSVPGAIPIVLKVALRCNLMHLGLTTGGTEREVVVPVGPPVNGVLPVIITVERITYVATNGDELWSTFAGPGGIELDTGKATFTGTETFVGGTGRFKGATGWTVTAGQAVDGRGFLTMSGTLGY